MVNKFSYFLCFEEHFKKNYAAFSAHAAHLYSSYRSNSKLLLMFILCSFYRIYIYIYIYIYPFMYIWAFFNKQYAVFVLSKHLIDILRR